MRPTTGRWAAGTGVALALLLGGCGADGPDEPSPPPPASAPAGETHLRVVVDDGTGTTLTWELTCDPAGGDHPDPVRACAVLAEHGEQALRAVAADAGCTQQYGGPQRAEIGGTWQGRDVATVVTRADGCQISRWDQLEGLLPAPTR